MSRREVHWERMLKTLLDLVQPFVGARLYGLPDFEANLPSFGGSTGDHAGKVETSLLWALEPEGVDVSRLPDRSEPGAHFAMGPSAFESDCRAGERMAADEARWLAAKGQELRAAYALEKPSRRLRTLAETEALWETADDSVWRANWPILTFPMAREQEEGR